MRLAVVAEPGLPHPGWCDRALRGTELAGQSDHGFAGATGA
jgi:hypothetical protein